MSSKIQVSLTSYLSDPCPMPRNLADRLIEERHSRFVGRSGALSIFESAPGAENLPFFILHIFGRGGVGKTTLLQEFAPLSERDGVQPVYLDAQHIDPAPDAFIKSLGASLGFNNGASCPIQSSCIARMLSSVRSLTGKPQAV